MPDSLATSNGASVGQNMTIGGALGVTGLSTLTGGLTVPANASRNIALNDTVSITGQLNVGTSGTAQSHYIYAGVDTTFIGRLSSQYLALFGNGSNNNLLSKGAAFNIGTSDVQDVYLYRNNTPMVELTSTGFVGKTPFNQTFAWQEDSLGREGRGGLVSSTRQIYWQNVGNFPKILEAVSGTGVSRFLFDSSGNETVSGLTVNANAAQNIALNDTVNILKQLTVGGATLDSAVSVTGGGHFSGGLVVGAKETIGTSLGIAGATVDSALSGTSGKLTGGLVVGKLLNFTGATGTATIGAGDSIQVSLAGITATAIVFLWYNMKTFASADTVPTYYIPAVGKFTIFGKYNKVVAWIVAHI